MASAVFVDYPSNVVALTPEPKKKKVSLVILIVSSGPEIPEN